MANKVASLPNSFRKVIAHKLSTNFSDATKIATVPMPVLKPKDILIKTRYLGINASDINVTAGRYFAKDTSTPFDTGFEALGQIVAVGNDVTHMRIGQYVGCMGLGAFAEYMCVPVQNVWTVPKLDPEYLALLLSGRTAAISLDKAGRISKKDTVLITAAAGGTGSIAVQYAKYLGCHVIGTCSSDDKVKTLQELKCDRPINYRQENINDVLKAEYPNGIDVVWESIGGQLFQTFLKNLSVRGRLIVIGFITDYKSDKGYKPMELSFLPRQLLSQSTSVTGFFVNHYQDEFAYYHVKLLGMYETNKFKICMDSGEKTPEGSFVGLESVTRAVQHLHSRTSKGKVFITMPE